jgi:hypothetical protein
MYCERQYKCRITNTGWLANSIYVVLKALLRKRTQDKMKFLGCNIDEIRSDLLEEMSIEVIPTIYGGNNEA